MRIFLLGATPEISSARQKMQLEKNADHAAAKLAKTGGNIGNQVIAYGLLQTLAYEHVEWDYSVGPQCVNSEFDVIVVAAANFLHTGFDLGGMASFIEATNLPCVMVGIGAQSNNYDPKLNLPRGTERFVRVVADRSRLIGTRGPFTSEVLAEMGILNTQVTGCPSYYMRNDRHLEVQNQPLTDAPKLAVNCSRDVVGHAFDKPKMIKTTCELLSITINRGADFFPQTEIPEISAGDGFYHTSIETITSEAIKAFPAFRDIAPTAQALEKWLTERIKTYWDVPSWINAMKKYDFVIGTRFHGNMVALQAGVPACVICHDTRTSEMCEFLRLPSIGLAELDHLDINELYRRVDPISLRARYEELYPLYRTFLIENNLSPRGLSPRSHIRSARPVDGP